MFVKVLLLLVCVSTAYSLQCYFCAGDECVKEGCEKVPGSDRCFSGELNGVRAKGCIAQSACSSSLSCCEGDLCNGTGPTGPTVLLLLVSSAVFTLFL